MRKPTLTHTLESLGLEEVSLVDNPGNQFSLMALWKNAPKPQGDDEMNIEQLTKQLETSEGQVADLTKSNTTLQEQLDAANAKHDKLAKALEGAGINVEAKDGDFKVAKAAEPEYIDVDGERVLKSSVPAPLLKRLEAQSSRLEALEKAAESSVLEKRAEQMFPNLGGTPAEKAALVKMLDSADEASRAALEKSLKAADAAVSKMFKEVGQGDAKDSEAQTQLDAMVAKHAEEQGITKQAAFAAVTKSGPGRDLLKQTRAEAN